MSATLEVKNLCKQYGDTVAVSDISFSIGEGEIVGLLGPNGAGKTTTINMLLGVLEPSSGSIKIGNRLLVTNRSAALERTNFAAVYAQLPGNLTVRQNLRIFGLLYGTKHLEQRISEVIRAFNLEKFADARSGVLSSGEQTRVGLAKAFLNKPALLLLDEPTASIDPSTAHEIRDLIQSFAKEHKSGVLWTSHNMYEVADVCDRVLFISHGKLLLAGDPRKLPAENGFDTLEELFISIAREPISTEQPDA